MFYSSQCHNASLICHLKGPAVLPRPGHAISKVGRRVGSPWSPGSTCKPDSDRCPSETQERIIFDPSAPLDAWLPDMTCRHEEVLATCRQMLLRWL